MKRRILFVDDEELVLQGLQRTLRPLRGEWEMEFVDSGVKALERMAQAPFDVIVSDMRMPGMNGAELLAEVMKRHPKTVRLILSGHADRDLILKCVGSTHQYLAKPCNADTLRATMIRAASVESTLRDDKLQALLKRMERLPRVPSLYVEIVEVLHRPETTVNQVGEIIARDKVMTGKILKLVNSAFFALRRKVSTPAEAAACLGLDTIRSFVLSIHAFSQFESLTLGRFPIDALWSHSLNTAAVARNIAQLDSADQKLADETFIAGMLHDTGKLVLAANFTEQFSEALQLAWKENLALFAAEMQVFGVTHAEVGGYLLGLWGLPVPVVEAIALHHCPGRASQKSFSPLTALHVANALVHQRDGDGTGEAGRVDSGYLSELGLSGRLNAWQEFVR
jgi:HD-like signal output (HDOD) protein